MKYHRLKEKPWYSMAVAISIGVILFVVLNHLESVTKALTTFLGYFTPVIAGCAIAYIVNPLSVFFERSIFRKVKKEKAKTVLSNVFAFVLVILLLAFLLVLLIPQLIQSVILFANNLSGYIDSLEALLRQLGLTNLLSGITDALDTSEKLMETIVTYVKANLSDFMDAGAVAGKSVIGFLVAFLLSMYLLGSKKQLKKGATKLLAGALTPERSEGVLSFFRRCDKILNRYIAFNILDSIIIGVANAIFMAILGMPYIGLVSFVVGVTNLVPTFGPIVGGAIGAFVLVLVKPWYALAFLIFTVVLQTVDGYVLKPKLFGGSLGISGLWILVGIVVGGRMFGVVGILLAIPVVAILDVLYREYLLPWLDKKREAAKKAKEEKKEAEEKEASADVLPPEDPGPSEPPENVK